MSKILVLLAFAAIGFIEIPGLVRQKYWRELAVFLFLLGIGLIVIVLTWFGVNIPFLMRE